MWLGVTEYLFCNEELLDDAIRASFEDSSHVSDDLEFTFGARVSVFRLQIPIMEIAQHAGKSLFDFPYVF